MLKFGKQSRGFWLATLMLSIVALGVVTIAAWGAQPLSPTNPGQSSTGQSSTGQSSPPQDSQNQNSQGQGKDQNIPDAPSSTRPPAQFPTNIPPSTESERPRTDLAQPPLPASAAPPSSSHPAARSGDADRPSSEPGSNQSSAPPPFPPVKTVGEGDATDDTAVSTREQLYTLKTGVNFVLLPVTVKDGSGRPVTGLLPRDFSVYEDGVKQKLRYFTSDPFPLSAAVIFDLGMPDVAVQKLNKTFAALEGAFSQYDEVSLYTYSSKVSKVADFGAVGKKLTAALGELKSVTGRNDGPVVTGGPLGPQGPIINGVPVDNGAPIVITPPKEAHTLNDAVLAAALDLGKRDRKRRKVIFIVSDGRETGSRASYKDVLKILLSNEITVYAMGVENAAIPVYRRIERIRLPKFSYDDILPKYASATGGDFSTEFSRAAIENAYDKVLADSRNRYTLGYTTRLTPSSTYREIDVRVDIPNVKVAAKAGYYPLPPGR